LFPLETSLSFRRLRRRREELVLPPARPSFPSASGGLWALGCVGERRIFVRRRRLGPRASRVRFLAAASRRRRRRRQGIRSSRVLPRLGGASLRLRQRTRGGGALDVEFLYRSPPATRWLTGEARVAREDFGCRWRVCVHGRRSLGCGPDRWAISDSFISLVGASVFCGFYQSLVAMEPRLTWGCWRFASGDGRR
ncbi:unnamed protein product, partial [Urochloa humidicola]